MDGDQGIGVGLLQSLPGRALCDMSEAQKRGPRRKQQPPRGKMAREETHGQDNQGTLCETYCLLFKTKLSPIWRIRDLPHCSLPPLVIPKPLVKLVTCKGLRQSLPQNGKEDERHTWVGWKVLRKMMPQSSEWQSGMWWQWKLGCSGRDTDALRSHQTKGKWPFLLEWRRRQLC